MRDKLSVERIEESRKKLATVINMLETIHERLSWTFESNDWDDGVKYQIEDATRLLGMSLATLTNWWDDEDEEDKQE